MKSDQVLNASTPLSGTEVKSSEVELGDTVGKCRITCSPVGTPGSNPTIVVEVRGDDLPWQPLPFENVGTPALGTDDATITAYRWVHKMPKDIVLGFDVNTAGWKKIRLSVAGGAGDTVILWITKLNRSNV